ncbi:MAG: class I SAM-dependent methyltransferase [Acidimicrobiales bacterium]
MSAYETFARFYDLVNGDPEARSRQILENIGRHRPGSTSVLELGCGTGAILAGLGSGFAVTGLDLSPEMLDYATRRCPSARLHLGDMTSFSLSEKFDVVLCVFDTLNHVETFVGWQSVFEGVRHHLHAHGIFIFDVNTLGRLRQLGEMAPWVHHFDENTLIMDVEFDGHSMSQWDIRVFEQQYGNHFVLHHETIPELGVPLAQIREALDARFELLEETDPGGFAPTDESSRAYFVYQLRS